MLFLVLAESKMSSFISLKLLKNSKYKFKPNAGLEKKNSKLRRAKVRYCFKI